MTIACLAGGTCREQGDLERRLAMAEQEQADKANARAQREQGHVQEKGKVQRQDATGHPSARRRAPTAVRRKSAGDGEAGRSLVQGDVAVQSEGAVNRSTTFKER